MKFSNYVFSLMKNLIKNINKCLNPSIKNLNDTRRANKFSEKIMF